MKLTYFAWIGETDLKSGETKDHNLVGPIASVLTDRSWSFERAVLLCNYTDDTRIERFIQWLRELGVRKQSINLRKVPLTSPINYREIYEAAYSIVEEFSRLPGQGFRPAFHLNPGTGAMQAIWVLLGKGRFSAKLIESSAERGVAETDIPFDIKAEFRRQVDDRVLNLYYGLAEETPDFKKILHTSVVMKEVVNQSKRAATRNVPVLIEGESGSGKELFAKAIHSASSRSGGPFVAVNCGAIPSELVESALFGHKKGSFTSAASDHTGYFEEASGGTLFLDEIGELPKNAQVKLLRALQEKKVRRVGDMRERLVDVRIVAATNLDLAKEVSDGTFRFDLFHRLAVAIIRLPPLRDRGGDLKLLTDKLLEKANEQLSEGVDYTQKKLSMSAAKAISEHTWPGNVRELENTLVRICLWTENGTITAEDVRRHLLPAVKTSTLPYTGKALYEDFNLNVVLEQIEKEYLERALDETKGHLDNARKVLGLNSAETLRFRMKKLGVTNPYRQKF